MGRIMVFNHVSMDGYFAATDGNLDWVVSEDRVGKDAMARSPAGDLIVFGRKTYELFASYWPNFAEQQTGPHGEKDTASMKEIAKFLNTTPKLVFSRTLRHPEWQPTQVLAALDPQAIAELKKDNNIIIFGSGSIVSQLTEHGLIDEYDLSVSPVALGGGKHMITNVSKPAKLRLAEAKSYPSGVELLRYTRA